MKCSACVLAKFVRLTNFASAVSKYSSAYVPVGKCYLINKNCKNLTYRFKAVMYVIKREDML